MNHKRIALGLCVALAGVGVQAQTPAEANIAKVGLTYYNPHATTNGVTGIGLPPGADAKVDDAVTVLLIYERLLHPNVGVEFVLGIPPVIHGQASGSVAFLGDNILTARTVAPTVFLNYHFGVPGDAWRPYLGAGINYTRFTDVKSKLATDVKLSSSTGLALQAGMAYAVNKNWGVFTSIAKLDVKSKLVASGGTVLQTTIDFRPLVYTVGTSYTF